MTISSLAGAARARGSRHDRRGQSLVEALIALLLITILLIALIDGLLTVTKVDTATNDIQRINAALNSFSEIVNDLEYEPCADAATYQARFAENLMRATSAAERQTLFGVAATTDVRVVKVEHFTESSFALADETTPLPQVAGSYSSVCNADAGSQRITLSAEYNDRYRTAQIVKRNPRGVSVEDYVAPITTVLPGNTIPVAEFTATKDPSCPSCWSFNSTSADTGLNAGIATWSWTFEPGSTAITENATHAFSAGGVFTVVLTVTDLDGAAASVRHTVSVNAKPGVPNNLRFVKRTDAGGAGYSYTWAWDKVAGVKYYELKVRWCLVIIWELGCSDLAPQQFGDVASGTFQKRWDATSVFRYYVSIRSRFNDQYSNSSAEIRRDA